MNNDSSRRKSMINNCGAFDSAITIHPDGKISPCCIFDHQYFKTFDQITDWKDPWKDLRDGKGCQACKHNGKTKYKESFDPYITNKEFKIQHLDIRNNNLCNLECTICNSYYSSKWAERLGKEKFISYTSLDLDLSDLKFIYFAGGEPLLNQYHYELINKLNDKSKIKLQYSSNLTTINKNLIETWKKFEHVYINASLDGIGKFGEYLRPGLKWDKWVENILYIKNNLSNCSLFINPTISLLNIWHLEELETWANNQGFKIRYNILKNPDYLCISALPTELKQKISHIPIDHNKNEDVIKQLLEIDNSILFNHTISNILLSDKLRKTDLWSYLPFDKWAVKNILDY